ncbi:MAG: hypothetical protein JW809_19430 [Pirellulales bacterium]|nr:hypothetical protein [Pirellulales bacterium]
MKRKERTCRSCRPPRGAVVEDWIARHRGACLAIVLGAVVAMMSLFAIAQGAEPKASATPPVALFAPFNLPMADGAVQTAMFVPGTTPGTVVLILPDFSTFDLVPRGDPNPVPPPPPPPPIDKAVAMYVIVETETVTPEEAQVRDAKAWRDAADAAKIRWAVADPDAASKTWPNVVAQAKTKGLPAIVFVDANGLASVEPLPATTEALVALVKAKGGVQ